MNNRTKNIIYSVILILTVYVVWLYRKNEAEPVMLEGPTMGTIYHVTYFDPTQRNFKTSIDSLLTEFNNCLSTYQGNSEISQFNAGTGTWRFKLPFFYPLLERSRELVAASDGAFDPTVGPLANIWGFGEDQPANPDSAAIDSIMTFVGFEKIAFNRDSVWKTDRRVKLNFNAIAPGYASDLIAQFLKSKGITNLFVEIGGEVVVAGRNLKSGNPWKIGILDPATTYEKKVVKKYASVSDRAMTTSGNYFNYREVNGRRISHTLDPETGYPVQRSILSATVFAPDCTAADGWSTAFMVMGHEKAIEKLKELKDIDAYLVYSLPDGSLAEYTTEGLKDILTEE